MSSNLNKSYQQGALTLLTSNITQHTWYTAFVIDSGVPDIVTARSVELGNISLATCIAAPVVYGKIIKHKRTNQQYRQCFTWYLLQGVRIPGREPNACI